MFDGYTMGELGAIFAMQGFAGLILFSVFVLMALGMAIIFGQMGVINMAHGEFIMAGAYTAYVLQPLVGEQAVLVALPVAWLGLLELRDHMAVTTLVPLSVVAGLVSLVGFVPDLIEDLPESTGWLLSLPQIAVSFLLCTEVARLVRESLSRRLLVLRWFFAVAAVGPVLLYGGGLDVTLVPLALLSVAANVYLVYLLFRASGQVTPKAKTAKATARARDFSFAIIVRFLLF